MKRIVLDTNVLVSGMLSRAGSPGAIVDLILDEQLHAVCSDEILEEYREVLARPKFALKSGEIETLLDQIVAGGLMLSPILWPLSLPDPDDGPFLAAAQMAACPLVTGNLKHYPKKSLMGVQVVTPREYLENFVSSL